MTPKSYAIKVISYDLCQPNDIWPILFSHPNLAKPHDDENHWFWIIKISSPAFQVSHGGYGIVFRMRISLFVTSLLISIRGNVPSSYKIQGDKGLIQIFFTPEQGKLIYHGLATGQDAPDTYWTGSELTTITHLQFHFWKNVF